ncbi:MAG: peptidylprolyl isomerase [Acidobacteriota bacterium]
MCEARVWRPKPRRLVVALLTLTAASACQSTPPAPARSPDAWAIVDGREIRRDDVEKAYRRAAPLSPVPSEEEALNAKLSLLNELIVQDILLAKARELKIEVPDQELDKEYAEARQNIPEDQFQQELAKRTLTAADMREGLRRELLVQKVIEREIGSKITVTDQDVSDFYNANRAQFNFPEDAYHLAQIVVTPVREPEGTNRTGDDATTADAAMYKVQMLMERLKAGASFNELARDYSEDPQSAAAGGDLGFVPLSALQKAPPALRDAVLKTTPGTVKVVSEGGAHSLVLIVRAEKAGQRDLTVPAVREGITATLRGRKEQLLRTAYLTAVRGDAKVENLLARLIVDAQGKMPTLAPKPPGTP